MKKTIILLAVFCLLVSYKSHACTLSGLGYGYYCEASGNSPVYDSGGYYIQPFSGLGFSMWAEGASDSDARVYATWETTGPVNFIYFYPSSPSTDRYYVDYYAVEGYMAIYAYANNGGSAGINAGW